MIWVVVYSVWSYYGRKTESGGAEMSKWGCFLLGVGVGLAVAGFIGIFTGWTPGYLLVGVCAVIMAALNDPDADASSGDVEVQK